MQVSVSSPKAWRGQASVQTSMSREIWVPYIDMSSKTSSNSTCLLLACSLVKEKRKLSCQNRIKFDKMKAWKCVWIFHKLWRDLAKHKSFWVSNLGLERSGIYLILWMKSRSCGLGLSERSLSGDVVSILYYHYLTLCLSATSYMDNKTCDRFTQSQSKQQ